MIEPRAGYCSERPGGWIHGSGRVYVSFLYGKKKRKGFTGFGGSRETNKTATPLYKAPLETGPNTTIKHGIRQTVQQN